MESKKIKNTPSDILSNMIASITPSKSDDEPYWWNYSIYSMSQVLKLSSFPSSIKGAYDQEEVENLRRCVIAKRVRLTDILERIQSKTTAGRVVSVTNALSKIDVATDGYSYQSGQVSSIVNGKASSAVRCVMGLAASTAEEFAVGSVCKMIASCTHKVDSVAYSLRPTKEDTTTKKYMTAAMAEIAKDIVDRAETPSVCSGNDLAANLFDVLSVGTRGEHKMILGRMLPYLPTEVSRMPRVTKDIEVAKGKKVTLAEFTGTAQFVPLSVDFSKMEDSVSRVLYDCFSTASTVRGTSRKGLALFAAESWDGIPLERPMRKAVNIIYDLNNAGVFDQKRVAIKCSDTELVASICAQFDPSDTIILYERKTDPTSRAERERIIASGHGFIAMSTLSARKIQRKMGDTKFFLVDLSKPTFANNQYKKVRKEATTFRNDSMAIAKKYEGGHFFYASYLAVASTKLDDYSKADVARENFKLILAARNKKNSDINMMASTMGHTHLVYCETSYKHKNCITHDEIAKALVNHIKISMLVPYIGYFMADYMTSVLKKPSMGKLVVKVIKDMKLAKNAMLSELLSTTMKDQISESLKFETLTLKDEISKVEPVIEDVRETTISSPSAESMYSFSFSSLGTPHSTVPLEASVDLATVWTTEVAEKGHNGEKFTGSDEEENLTDVMLSDPDFLRTVDDLDNESGSESDSSGTESNVASKRKKVGNTIRDRKKNRESLM